VSREDHPLYPMLRKLARRHALGAEDEAALLGLPFTKRALQIHHYMVWDGERPNHCCVMLAGFAYRHKLVGSGGRQILSLHMRGDIVNLASAMLLVADHDVQMLTAGEVAMIPLPALRAVAAARPAIGTALWCETLVDGAILREWIVNIGRRAAPARIAHLLCEFALRLEAAGLGTRDGYRIPMSQEELADALGLSAVHVNRTLMDLGKAGLISRTQRDVRIADWQALAEAGDFQPNYLHLGSAEREASGARADELALS
jgi:CRP-like cAMP-binding protein